MSSNKKTKSKFSFIIICIIGFVVSFLFEFYFISYFPYDYFMLFGTGIIMCIFGYLSIDGVLEIINQTSQKRDEQNEIMIKASKAIYLTTKKIALNGSHSIPDTLETPKDIGSLIDDLSQANERLAREVENAVSLQSLVQKNRTIVNNAREIIEDHEQPLSPLEVEKDLKLDEAISETDFETVTRPETIDSMIRQEVSSQEADVQGASGITVQKASAAEISMEADVLEETIEAVGNVVKEAEKTPEPISDSSALKASEPVSDSSALKASEPVSDSSISKASETASDTITASKTVSDSHQESENALETISDIFSEVKETASYVLNSSAENIDEMAENNIAAESSIVAESSSKTAESNISAESSSKTTESNISAEDIKTANSNVSAKNSNITDNNLTAESNLMAENGETANSNISTEGSNIAENNLMAESNLTAENGETANSNVLAEGSSIAENNLMANPATENSETVKSNVSAESSKAAESMNTTVSKPEIPSAQSGFPVSSSKTPAANSGAADKPMTSEEIAALFANL